MTNETDTLRPPPPDKGTDPKVLVRSTGFLSYHISSSSDRNTKLRLETLELKKFDPVTLPKILFGQPRLTAHNFVVEMS